MTSVGTTLYGPSVSERHSNRALMQFDEQLGSVEPTGAGSWFGCLTNDWADDIEWPFAVKEPVTNSERAYEVECAGTAQPLILGISRWQPDQVWCGDGLFTVASAPKRWHVVPNWVVEASEPEAPRILALMFVPVPTRARRASALTMTDRLGARSGTAEVAQREEKRATAALVRSIQSLLPGSSEQELGALVRVSRVTWRDWQSGTRVARPRKRRQLLRLKRILELRLSAAPTQPLTHWLDMPLGKDLDLTPRRLLEEGRDQVVAVLAARAGVPEGDEFSVDRPLDLGGLERDPARLEMEDRAILRAGYAAEEGA